HTSASRRTAEPLRNARPHQTLVVRRTAAAPFGPTKDRRTADGGPRPSTNQSTSRKSRVGCSDLARTDRVLADPPRRPSSEELRTKRLHWRSRPSARCPASPPSRLCSTQQVPPGLESRT